MKSFFQFLSEAAESQAAIRAKKLGYTGDGHGAWIDRSGKVVARTENGELKFVGKRTPKGAEEPADERKSAAAPQAQDTSRYKHNLLHNPQEHHSRNQRVNQMRKDLH